MSTAELIIQTIQSLPEEQQREVLDFAEFLGGKSARVQAATGKSFDFIPMRLTGWPEDCNFHREDLYGDDAR